MGWLHGTPGDHVAQVAPSALLGADGMPIRSDVGADEYLRYETRQRVPWLQLRRRWGAARDRLAALQLVCAATDYEPLWYQTRAHLADGAHKLILGGVGSGKTWYSMAELLCLIVLCPGRRWAAMAPTVDQTLHVLRPRFKDLVDQMAESGYPIERRWRMSLSRSDLVCGGQIYWRSFGKVDNLRGYTLAGAALDETEQHSDPGYVWDVIQGRMRDRKSPIRQMFATTTPDGLRGVVRKFARVRRMGDADRRRNWWVGRAKTFDNPHLPDDYIENMAAGYSKRQAEQELEGKVLQPANVIYPEFDRGRHVIPYRYDPALPYDLACDWGDSRPHILWIQRTPRDEGIIFDEYCADGDPIDKQREVIAQRCARLGKQPVHIAGDRAVKKMNQWAVQRFTSSRLVKMDSRQEQSVKEGIEVTRAMLDPLFGEPRLYVAQHLVPRGIPDETERGIVACLEGYRWRDATHEQLSPLKDGRLDNGADALRYWCRKVGSGETGLYVVGRMSHRRNKYGDRRVQT